MTDSLSTVFSIFALFSPEEPVCRLSCWRRNICWRRLIWKRRLIVVMISRPTLKTHYTQCKFLYTSWLRCIQLWDKYFIYICRKCNVPISCIDACNYTYVHCRVQIKDFFWPTNFQFCFLKETRIFPYQLLFEIGRLLSCCRRSRCAQCLVVT